MDQVAGVAIPGAEDVKIQKVEERASKKSATRFGAETPHGQKTTWRFNDRLIGT